MKLENWVNEKYLFEQKQKKCSEKFLENKPFEYLSLNDFLIEDKLQKLKLHLDKMEYYHEDSDLYSFNRTVDFKNFSEPFIKEFRSFIFSEEFISLIEKFTGVVLSRKKGDLHSLKLKNTNYLLCHDDQVQGRAIAFILNFSENWTEKMGGSLNLFSVDENKQPIKVSAKIIPKNNQFNFFKVSEISFHEISEVTSKNNERLSISGWFYND